MFEKKALSHVDLADVIAWRWSGRAFDPERRIERHTLVALLEATRWAPSCFGDEPWHYIIWDRFEDRGNWQRAFECLAEGNQSWASNAPLLMVAIADTSDDRTGDGAQKAARHQSTELPEVAVVPYRTGTENVNDRPEGLTLYSDDKESTALLVVYAQGAWAGSPERAISGPTCSR